MTYPPQDPYGQQSPYPQQTPYGQPGPQQQPYPQQAPQPGPFHQPSPYPQQYATPAVIDDGRRSRKRPIGVMLMVAGVAALAIGIFVAITTFPRPGDFPRTSGTDSTVELTAGEWTVYAEGFGNRPISIEAPDGSAIALGPKFSTTTYTLGGRSGESVGVIDAPVDGTYTVVTEPGDTFAFGQNFERQLALSIVAGTVGFFGALALLGLGLVLVVIGGRR